MSLDELIIEPAFTVNWTRYTDRIAEKVYDEEISLDLLGDVVYVEHECCKGSTYEVPGHFTGGDFVPLYVPFPTFPERAGKEAPSPTILVSQTSEEWGRQAPESWRQLQVILDKADIHDYVVTQGSCDMLLNPSSYCYPSRYRSFILPIGEEFVVVHQWDCESG